MKKITCLFIFLSLFTSLYGDSTIEDKDIKEVKLSTEPLEDRAKIGVALGYPMGVTFGYRAANYLEANAFVGTFFNGGVTVGANLLYTVAEIDIQGEKFPLSVGPTVLMDFGNDFDMSVLGTVRFEYTFDEIPLNLYLEGGPGFSFIQGFDFIWSTSLGVRYVF